MNILITAATAMEIAPFISPNYKGKHAVEVLISGVGGTSTAFQLTKILGRKKYDWVIQGGIAGSYRQDWAPGKVVLVKDDTYGDLGAEEADGRFSNFIGSNLIAADEFPFYKGIMTNFYLESLSYLPFETASAITVNTTSGAAPTIAQRQSQGKDIETMEGAALHYVCLQMAQPFIQLRALSNYVAPRNKNDWHIDLAINNLNTALSETLESF